MIFFNSFKAQSTFEYLIIVGVIVVVGLVSVGLFSGFLGSFSDSSVSASKAFWLSQLLGVNDVGIDAQGDSFFVLSNNTGETITLLGYSIDSDIKYFTYEKPILNAGEKKVVFLARQTACPGNTCSLTNVRFLYRSANGLEKSSKGNDLIVEKQNDVSYALFSGSTTNLVCVNSGDVGQCGSGGTDTNTFTAGIMAPDNNRWLIDLNVFGKNIYTNKNLYVTDNIGIGTTSPSNKLHIQSANGTGTIFATNETTGTSNGDRVLFNVKSPTVNGYFQSVPGTFGYAERNDTISLDAASDATALLIGTLGNAPIIFYTGCDVRGCQRGTITGTGNFGIGTTSPSEKLDVNGNIIGSNPLGFNISSTIQDKDLNLTINDGGTTRTAIQINGDEGSVTIPRQSYVHAYRNGDKVIANNTETTVDFNAENYDVLSEYTPSTGTFTAKDAGKYLVTTNIYWSTLAAPSTSQVRINKGGTGVMAYNTTYMTAAFSQSVSAVIDLAAGGTITISVYQNSGGNCTVYGPTSNVTFLTITKVA